MDGHEKIATKCEDEPAVKGGRPRLSWQSAAIQQGVVLCLQPQQWPDTLDPGTSYTLHWAERVAYTGSTGSPAPAIGARWQPPFTVGMRVLEDKDDLGRLLTLLRDDPYAPKWPVIRPCHFHSCPCQSLNAKLNDQLFSVVRHDLKIEEFHRKFCTMPCHMLQEDDLSKTSFVKRRSLNAF